MATLKAQHLAKAYKSRQVVRDVSQRPLVDSHARRHRALSHWRHRATVMTACVLLMVVVYPSFLMASSGSFAASIIDRKSTRLNSSHVRKSRMPSSA